MNKVLVASSALFVVPFILAVCYDQTNVSLATLVCFVTSICNHYYETRELRAIDIVVVNSIAAYFAWHAAACLGRNGAPVLVLAAATLSYYIYTKAAARPDEWHAPVHLMASLGICAYIIACGR